MNVAQPHIRFATTVDGVPIGFWEVGSGPTLLLAQNRSLSHAELEWSVPSMMGLYLELAKYFRVVRFDPRGAGVSGEPPEEGVTHQGLATDIEAVADALHAEQLNLVGAISLGPAAVQYAVDHPERITRLVLCDTGPRLADLPLDRYVKATDALVELGVVPSLGGLFPSTPTEDLPALESLMKGSLYNRPRTKPRDLRDFDVTGVLDQVKAPTLVVKSQDSVYTDMTQTRLLLAGLARSEMRVVPGTMAPWLADRDLMVDAFVSFLTAGHHRPTAARGDGLLTVVFTDLVSSTQWLDSRGDEAGRLEFRTIEELTEHSCSNHGGAVIKNLGDGSLLTFKSTTQALSFSLEVQERMKSRPVQMRIGMAAGEPIREDGDIHGAVVVQASRIADLGEAGDILVADSVRQLAVGKGFQFESYGDVEIKGFDEPQRVWRLTGSSDSATAAADRKTSSAPGAF